MKKVTIEVSNQELDALEDLLYAWTLCNRHNDICSEEERFIYTQTCSKCIKMNDAIKDKAGSIWHKLVHEYDR